MIKINHEFEEVKIVGKHSLGSLLSKVAIQGWGGFMSNPLLPILKTQDKEYQNVYWNEFYRPTLSRGGLKLPCCWNPDSN